jgi:ABC-type transporter lipoprotein component MlaA
MKQYFKMAIIATALSSVVGCQSTNNTETSVAVEKTEPYHQYQHLMYYKNNTL